jgi:hypothetical protein
MSKSRSSKTKRKGRIGREERKRRSEKQSIEGLWGEGKVRGDQNKDE